MEAGVERSPYAPPEADVGVFKGKPPRPIAVMLLQAALLLQLVYIALAVLRGGVVGSAWDFSDIPDVWISAAIVFAYSGVLVGAFVGLVWRSFWGRWVSCLGLLGFGCLFLVMGIAGVMQALLSPVFKSGGWQFSALLVGLGLLFMLWMYLVVFSKKARRFYGAAV